MIPAPMLSFQTEGPPWVIRFPDRGYQLRVYPTRNPATVPNREALSYLVGQTVSIDGVERLVAGVESFCLGGPCAAGRSIGLAVKEDLSP